MAFEEEQILFEAEDGKTRYTWQPARVELDPTAGIVTIQGYLDDRLSSLPERLAYTIPVSELPDGTPTSTVPVADIPDGWPMITVPVREITSCEIVERKDISRNLSRMLEGVGSGGDVFSVLLGLLCVYLWIIDVLVAKTTKVPVIKLMQSRSDDSGQGWVIHLRSQKSGHRGRVATFRMAQRIVAFLRRSGYDGAIPEELSVPRDSEASLKLRWIVTGSLAIVLAWIAAVFFGSSVGSYMMGAGSPFWLVGNLASILEGISRGSRYGFCCTLPVLAFGLFLLWIAGGGFILGQLRRSSFVAVIILGVIVALVGGCLTGWFGVVELYY
jgi:hypothetical protein